MLLTALWLLAACDRTGWRGFAREDLSQYLTLGNYRGLSRPAISVSVSDREIDDALAALLDTKAVLIPVETSLSDGMVVAFDRFCFLENVSTPALSEEDGQYVCGRDNADPVVNALLARMKGMTLGDTAEFTVTLPAGYVEPGSEPCEAVYRVTVRALYEKEPPPLTDETAASLRAGVTTVEGLRAALSADLSAEKKAAATERIETELWNRIVSDSVLLKKPFDLYQEYYTDLYHTYEALAEASSVSLSDYLVSQSMTLSSLENNLMEQADAQVKEALIRHEIAKREGISCTEAEILSYADRQASESGLFSSGAEYIEYYGKDAVSEELLSEKVLARVVELSVPS